MLTLGEEMLLLLFGRRRRQQQLETALANERLKGDIKQDYRVTRVDRGTWVGLTSIWDVPQAVGLYCSFGVAQARQWNIPN